MATTPIHPTTKTPIQPSSHNTIQASSHPISQPSRATQPSNRPVIQHVPKSSCIAVVVVVAVAAVVAIAVDFDVDVTVAVAVVAPTFVFAGGARREVCIATLASRYVGEQYARALPSLRPYPRQVPMLAIRGNGMLPRSFLALHRNKT